ncbi:MAG: hypothetical protein ACLFN8_03135 [Candidatus Woesearchaeota archaeon]
MMLLKNKKADAGGTGQQQLFLFAELVIGALIIAAGIYNVIELTGSSKTEVITKDLGVLIESLSHQAIEASYNYLLPEFITRITITQDTITLYSDTGHSTKKLNLNKNMNIIPITLSSPDMIPIFISYKNKVIKFEQGDATSCTTLRLLPETKKFTIKTQGTKEEEISLNRLNTNFEILDIRQELFLKNPEPQTTQIIIKFNKENNFEVILPQNPEYESLRCFAEDMFLGQEDVLFENLIVSEKNQNEIIISLGSYNKIKDLTNNEEDTILTKYAQEIIQTIKRGKR